MPDTTTTPPTLSSSTAKLPSQRGGGGGGGGGSGGRFHPAARKSTTTTPATQPPGTSHPNPQHPGHIPGSLSSRPLNGIFAIDKPSGKTCMELLDTLKDLLAYSPLFRNPDGTLPEGHGGNAWRPAGGKKHLKGKAAAAPPKIGQGGTLDPLASGVLVIGLGSGTKQLQRYLDGEKTYETTALLGVATASYDSQDPIMSRAAHSHVTRQAVEALLPRFTGPLLQYPPIYSAVRMDGKRLFDYARQGLQLPRPIAPREIEIRSIECFQWLPAGEHPFSPPDKEVSPEEKLLLGKVKEIVVKSGSGGSELATGPRSPSSAVTGGSIHAGEGNTAASSIPAGVTAAESESKSEDTLTSSSSSSSPAAAFKLRMTVSGGTYVRTIVHDIGQACGSAAHVVQLRRVQQGQWALPLSGGDVLDQEDQTHTHTRERNNQDQKEESTLPTSSSSTHPTSDSSLLPCLPWSLFLSALEQQKNEADPNARNARPKDRIQSVQEESKEMVEPPPQQQGGEEGEEELVELKEWEKELLRVIVPC